MAKPTLIVPGESFSSDRRSVNRPQAQPLDFSPAIRASQNVFDLGEEMQKLDDAQALASAQQQATEEMDLLQRELREAGGAALAQDAFMQRSADIQNRIASQLGGDRLRDRFSVMWNDLYHGHRLKVIDQAFSKGVAASRELYRSTAGRLADAASEEDDPRMADNWLRQIDKGADDLVQDGLMTREEADVERMTFHRKAAGRSAARLIERDPDLAAAVLEAGSPRFAALPEDDRNELVAEAKSASELRKVSALSASAESQAEMKARVRANLDAVDGSGTDGDTALDFDDVRAALGDDVAKEWRSARRQAKDGFWMRKSMAKLSGPALDKFVKERAGKLDFDVEGWAGRVLKDRAEDPARAADQAFDGQAINFDSDPSEIGGVLSRRMRNQDILGIDDGSRRILTNAEAVELQRRMTTLQASGPDGMLSSMRELDRMFGPHAQTALEETLLVSSRDRDMARVGSQIARKIGMGAQPTVAESQALQVVSGSSAAERAFSPAASLAPGNEWVPGSGERLPQQSAKARSTAPAPRGAVPNHSQIQMLLQKPELAAQFEQKFGRGAARFYLDQRQDPSSSYAADGGTATIAPDGSESWVPGSGVQYIEDDKGGVIRVEADGSETMLIPPKGMQAQQPKDPAAHQRMLDEYKKSKGGGVQYIEDDKGGVIRVEADGSETMLIPPKGMPSSPPSDPEAHRRMLEEYKKSKKSGR